MIMLRLQKLLAVLGCVPALGLAATPTVTSVLGSVQTGQILTVTGTSMVDEDRGNWDPFFVNKPGAAGFEGTSFTGDGWAGGEAFTYVSDVKLMGSKSARSHHDGATAFPIQHSNISYNNNLSIGGDLYLRAYLRFKVTNGIWANNYHKIFGSYSPNGAVLDWIGNGGKPFTQVAVINDVNHYGPIPGGAIQENRWYCVELKLPSGSPHNYRVWIDNQLVVDFNDTKSPQGTANDIQFDINHCCTPAGYSKDNWWDGFVVSRTRVGPASLVEIGSSSDYATATKRYQAPEYLSDSSIQIKVNLSGLGAGPYFLWVTNNRGQRSPPVPLSTSGTVPTPVNLRLR